MRNNDSAGTARVLSTAALAAASLIAAQAQAQTQTWTRIAAEGQTFAISGTRTVRCIQCTSTTENDIILTAKLAAGTRGGTFTSGQVIVTVAYSPLFGDDF